MMTFNNLSTDPEAKTGSPDSLRRVEGVEELLLSSGCHPCSGIRDSEDQALFSGAPVMTVPTAKMKNATPSMHRVNRIADQIA